MCCTNPSSTVPVCTTTAQSMPLQCGCGCLGKEQTTANLQRNREHLKAELNYIESRIKEIENNCQ